MYEKMFVTKFFFYILKPTFRLTSYHNSKKKIKQIKTELDSKDPIESRPFTVKNVQVNLPKNSGKLTRTVHVFWRSCTIPARYLYVPVNAGDFT